jgi:hypothetical protein
MNPFEFFATTVVGKVIEYMESNNKLHEESSDYLIMMLIGILTKLHNPESDLLTYENKLIFSKIEEAFRKFDVEFDINHDFLESVDIPEIISTLEEKKLELPEQQIQNMCTLIKEFKNFMERAVESKEKGDDFDEEENSFEFSVEEDENDLVNTAIKSMMFSYTMELLNNLLTKKLNSSTEAGHLALEILKSIAGESDYHIE